jgi:hypothetical protein
MERRLVRKAPKGRNHPKWQQLIESRRLLGQENPRNAIENQVENSSLKPERGKEPATKPQGKLSQGTHSLTPNISF